MATELTLAVRTLFDELDNLNFDAIRGHLTADAQGVDELSRRWMRNPDEIGDYFAQMKTVVSDVQSHLSDAHEVNWGDTGVVTFWLEQSYVLEGTPQRVSAPTTVVLRREDGSWKAALIHSVPLPDEA